MAQFSLTDTYKDYFENSQNLSTFSQIRTLDSQRVGYGAGATRHYVNHIFNDMIKNKIISLNLYFLKF